MSIEETKMRQNGYAREREREREEMAEPGSRRGRFSRSGDQIRGREKIDWMAAEEEKKESQRQKQQRKKGRQGGPGLLFWRAFNFMGVRGQV